MKGRILVVEDVKEMADLVALYLEKEGMEVLACPTAEEGLARLSVGGIDLVVLDINLPGMDGFEFLQEVRQSSAVPVIIVSARDSDEDMILGLGVGADEFVTKPFSPRVLTARVRALLRRAGGMGDRENTVSFGPFTLDLDGCLLWKGAEKVPLSNREFEVLSFLAAHPGRAMAPETVYAEVWRNQYGDVTAVGVYIQRLRRKIEADPAAPAFIQTVHGMGYRFDPRGVLP
jgi:DNA-binding response OmpR family regulator